MYETFPERRRKVDDLFIGSIGNRGENGVGPNLEPGDISLLSRPGGQAGPTISEFF